MKFVSHRTADRTAALQLWEQQVTVRVVVSDVLPVAKWVTSHLSKVCQTILHRGISMKYHGLQIHHNTEETSQHAYAAV